jgi:hypothetical protein
MGEGVDRFSSSKSGCDEAAKVACELTMDARKFSDAGAGLRP